MHQKESPRASELLLFYRRITSLIPKRIPRIPCSFLWRFGMIEQTPILVIKIAVPVALQPVRHHAEQKMARKVMGWGPPEHGMPTAVEIAQTRDLDAKRFTVRQRRTDRYPWHRDQPGRRRAARVLGLPPSLVLIW